MKRKFGVSYNIRHSILWRRPIHCHPHLCFFRKLCCRFDSQYSHQPSFKRIGAKNGVATAHRSSPSTASTMQSANYMWCALFVCIVLMSGSSHGLLTTGEKDALAELLSIFPNLGYIGTSQVGHDQNIDYGRAWTNNFDSLCLSDGYDYYGLYCSGGHISGLVLYVAFMGWLVICKY